MDTLFKRLHRIWSSTSFRLGVIQAATFTVSVSALIVYVYLHAASWLAEQGDQNIEDDLNALVDEVNQRGLGSAAAKINRMLASLDQSDQFVLLVDGKGQILAGNAPAIPQEVGWIEMPLATELEASGWPKNREHIVRGRSIRVADGALLFVGQDIWAAGEVREIIIRGFMICLAATIVIAFATTLLAALYVLGRVKGISGASRRIIAGDLRERVPLSQRHDEFDELAIQLNAMLDRINELLEDIRQVTNDIAHDLRTPLAHLRQRLERTRRRSSTIAAYETATDESIADTDALLSTFTAMLRIAQIDAGTRRAGFARVDLSRLLASLVDTFSVVAEDSQRTISGSIAAGIRIHGDLELLNQLFANLIENALTHTAPGAHVNVALAPAAGGGAMAKVEDNGPGIPESMRERVLKPFVRMESHRASPGTGLGLASVAAIARLHGLQLELADAQPGLSVTVRFLEEIPER